MASFIVLLGPPGVGKGTQATIIAKKMGLPHISSGDLFRENMKNQTDLGKQVQAYMDRGELVPDDLTIAMVRERLSRPDCAKGAILDGFPRTPEQARALSGILGTRSADVGLVPFLNADPDVLVERLSGRLTCRAGGHVYHRKFNPPAVNGKCDVDGSDLMQREDDKAETVSRRLRVYMEQTSPLINHYKAEGKLVEINGELPVEQVTAALERAIGIR
jgi:adenylate kinase